MIYKEMLPMAVSRALPMCGDITPWTQCVRS